MDWFRGRLPISFFNCNGRRYTYHVFLNFRGRDVRKGFLGHLHNGLESAGFRTFLDTHDLNSGCDISVSLQQAIEASRILIPIFSPNYAESTWCLREATIIARQVQNGSAIAIPLFHGVTPAQVRWPEQSGGPYAQAFQEHASSGLYTEDEIGEWKEALSLLCGLAGLSLQDDYNGYEAALVKRVVEEVGKRCKGRPSIKSFWFRRSIQFLCFDGCTSGSIQKKKKL